MLARLFFILISPAGMWNNEKIFNYNLIYLVDVGSPIQYFSNQNANDFYNEHGRRFLESMPFKSLRFITEGFPSGSFRAETDQSYMQPYYLFTKRYIEETNKPSINKEIASNHRFCHQDLKSASIYGPISISKIIEGHFPRCKTIQLIELIHFRLIKIVRSKDDCRYDRQRLCMVEDKRVEAKSVKDKFQPIAAVRSNGRNAYLVTVEGILKIILQKSADEYIIIPKLGGLPTNDIYKFLSRFDYPSDSADVSNLESASIDLFSSTTDEGTRIFNEFISTHNLK
ncbi:BgTH12-06212 [Blumeria graminis f. sp. triticale]|uniref:BgTH12-06212 n=1 Tax=Blumeria graminis f. sp. triticale TaxID=1689686 RepID=A0A9W4D548_BLUGR|nr:BgTH12-06212 [Blumeria graminis f. sp. triticale]